MKLLQLNMWGGRLESQIVDLVRREKPDILCLQEAIDLPGGKGALFVTIEEVQAAAEAAHVYMSPVYSLRYMSRTARFGNCIISKFPFKHTETVFTEGLHTTDFETLQHGYNIRNLQYTTVDLPDGSNLHVLNHHGHHVHQHKNGDAETMRQCATIADRIRLLEGKIVLAGDFNLAPHSESLEQINTVLNNLPARENLETTRTVLTHKTEVCDYIFTNDAVKVQAFNALDDIVSDHKALMLEFA